MSEPTWLEVSLTVDGEMAEAVSEVLARFSPGGVAIHATRIDFDEDGEGIGAGLLRVSAYLSQGPDLDETRRRLEESLWYLGRIRPLPRPEYQWVQNTNWAEAWKERYQPILIGKRLMILPAWLENPDQGRIPVKIEPGMAFGTGTHPSTKLCLEVIEELAQPEMDVIDVGCGSGILSVAALKLGCRRALAVDIDIETLPSARENARLNGIGKELEIGHGSLHEVQSGFFGLRRAGLVVANILAPVIVRLLDEGLADLLLPGGSLVLSGILEPQLDGKEGHVSVLKSLEKHALAVRATRQIDDWVALVVYSSRSTHLAKSSGGR